MRSFLLVILFLGTLLFFVPITLMAQETEPTSSQGEVSSTEEAGDASSEVDNEGEGVEEANASEEESEDSERGKEEAEEVGEIKVEEKVSGTYAPEPTPKIVINAEELKRSALEELTGLSRFSSFNIQEFFGGNALSILGLNPKFTLILVDGQRVAGRIDEKIDASQLPLLSVDRIEVIRGPLATIYGSGAVAGVVNIITKVPQDKLTANYLTRGGSHSFNSQFFELAGTEGTKKYLLAYRRAQRSSFDLYKRNPATDGDAFLNQFLKLRYSTQLGNKTEVNLSGSLFEENNNNIQTTFGGLARRGDFDTTRTDYSLSLIRKLNATSELSLSHNLSEYGHNVRTTLVNIEAVSPTEDRFRDEVRDTELSYKGYGERYLIQAGVGRSREHINSPRILIERASFWLNSFFVNYEAYLSGGNSLSLGLRYDEHKSFGSEFSPKVSFWKDGKKVDFRIGYGKGFRAPSLKERYFEFNSPFGYTVRGNPNLTPEIANTFLVGISFTPNDKSAFDITAFESKVSGMILPTEVRSNPLIFREINVARARSSGVTITASSLLSRRFRLSLDQTYTIAKDEDTGNFLPQNPKYRGVLSLLYQSSDKWEAELVGTLASSQYTSLENTRIAPGHGTLDANISVKSRYGKIILNVRNVFDRVNGTYGPKPGREFFLSLERSL